MRTSLFFRFAAVGSVALAVSLASALPVSAQRRPAVTFSVDTRYADLADGDRVALRGSSPALGAWDRDIRLQADGSVWSGTARLDAPGETVAYKYVVVRRGGEVVWEEGDNRRLVVPVDDLALPLAAFSGLDTPGLSGPVRLTLAADLSGLYFDGDPPEAVALYGSRAPLGWRLDEDRLAVGDGALLSPGSADGLWTVTVDFPQGTPPDVQFKLAFLVDGRWEWEYLPGHVNHALLLDAGLLAPRVTVAPDPQSGRLVASGPSSLHVDDYAAIADQVGPRSLHTGYAYAHAIHLARAGRLEEARAAYAPFAEAAGAMIDDFPQIYAGRLAESGAVGDAGAFLLDHEQAATAPGRKADLAFARAELMLRHGQTHEGRRLLRQVLQTYASEADAARAVGYARTALASSLIQGPQAPPTSDLDPGEPTPPPGERTDLDSVAVGLQMLQDVAAVQNGERRTGALNLLAHAYESLGRFPEARATYQTLEGEGTPAEQFRSLRARVRLQLQAGEAKAVVEEADTRLAESGLGARARASWLYAKAVALRQQGDTEAEQTTLETLVGLEQRGGAAAYAQRRLAELTEG